MADDVQTSSLESGDARVFERVTEALRAGPGTAVWEEALREVGGAKAVDTAAEMELLARVRRRLAAGRGWREVSAGPAFTAKLMSGLDESPAKQGGMTVTAWVIAVCAFVLAGVIGAVWMNNRAPSPVAQGSGPNAGNGGSAIPDPGGDGTRTETGGANGGGIQTGGTTGEPGKYATPLVAWDFGMPWPAGTSLQGLLPLESSSDGLRVRPGKVSSEAPVSGSPAGEATDWVRGDAVLNLPASAAKGVTLELTVRMPAKLEPNLLTQLVIGRNDAGNQGAPGSAEIDSAWSCNIDSTGLKVSSASRESEVAAVGGGVPPAGETLVIRVALDRDRAELSTSDGRHWSGPHGLKLADIQRVGVRFLAHGTVRGDATPTVKLLRVLGGR